MGQRVVLVSDGHRVEGCGADGELVNRFLAHLGSRAFSPATVRAYAYDLLNFLRFLGGRDARLADVVAMDLFDYLDWQQRPVSTAGRPVGGLRAAEVGSLRLADVDMGLRRLRVTGKGGKERVVPVDGAFFAELAAYLREERPAGCRAAECFVVLRGPTAGQPLTEAGLRRIFRTHRLGSGALRVRPHRLRHTYGTELASAGIDLLALRELMGHANPETTAAYVNLSPQALAAEYARARAAAR